jgi:23S rRNA U2552 (ribose-2'-O)-methylase RlmE/FtsJ
MTWAQRLKRVFGIDIQTCAACGGAVRIIACIEDPEVIEKILAHLDKKTTESPRMAPALPGAAAARLVRFTRFTGMTPRRLSQAAPTMVRPRCRLGGWQGWA